MLKTGQLTLGQLLGLVREKLYVPDGKPPPGWTIARCASVIKRLLNQGYSSNDVADAIEGIALMRDAGELDWCARGDKLTMRALYGTRHGVRPLLPQAQETLYQRAKRPTPAVRQGTPEHISAMLGKILPTKETR
jgi:hypothetical protein